MSNSSINTAPRPDDDDDAVCPVCKSSRYLNPNMAFLVNPECYHKMYAARLGNGCLTLRCDACVDRIFTSGPAKCPVFGCNKTLRKARFKKQTFENIAVEREVDVRKRVSNTYAYEQPCLHSFNKTSNEFDSLREYNDYLEQVEEITFNLVNGIDIAETETKLRSYESENAEQIVLNRKKSRMEAQAFAQLKKAEEEERTQAAELARLEQEEERRDREENAQSMLRNLAGSSTDADTIVQENKILALKRSTARRKQMDEALLATKSHKLNSTKAKEEIKDPFDPLEGQIAPTPPFTVHASYNDPFLHKMQNDVAAMAGGFRIENVYHRALSDAFMGLTCGIEKL